MSRKVYGVRNGCLSIYLQSTKQKEGVIKPDPEQDTGKELWAFNTGSGIVGSPITWEENGEQFVTVVSGWGGAVPLWGGEVAKTVAHLNQGGMVWTFKMPKKTAQK